ncbi:MAG: undecaprenyldiphospho-muramoylpentapeptide beta-N-acetylglucosaminyltransferase [Bdellovibrionales bacterium]|nr:undecaprenyldiphospho-muramoylpentapeptide beta-N-acetylglucosaminyltransferase [Bdellovibrionales bacterium]
MADSIVIAAGGTGGHIYPGVAIAQALKQLHPNLEIHFVGSEGGMESRVIPPLGFPLHKLPVGPLHSSSGLKKRLSTLFRLPKVALQTWRVLRVLKPKFLLGVGGYASGPALFVGHFMGYRTFIWEPNAMPGWTNRILSRFVDEAFVVFEEARKYLKCKKVTAMGMPLRPQIENAPPKSFSSVQSQNSQDSKFHVFVFGGSQGAKSINDCLSELLTAPSWRNRLAGFEFVHQTGQRDFDRMQSLYEQHKSSLAAPVQVLEYVSDMEAKYQWADLVISRSGTGTLSELAALGVPSVLVPYPFAADNHQQKNAEALVERGAARMILNADLNPASLLSILEDFRSHSETLAKLAKAALGFHKKGAAHELAQTLWERIS